MKRLDKSCRFNGSTKVTGLMVVKTWKSRFSEFRKGFEGLKVFNEFCNVSRSFGIFPQEHFILKLPDQFLS